MLVLRVSYHLFSEMNVCSKPYNVNNNLKANHPTGGVYLLNFLWLVLFREVSNMFGGQRGLGEAGVWANVSFVNYFAT